MSKRIIEEDPQPDDTKFDGVGYWIAAVLIGLALVVAVMLLR